MSKGGPTTQKTSSTPYAPYIPGHELFASESLAAYNDPQSFFPGQTVEGRSADTALSFDMLREFTTGNNPSAAAGEFLGEVMGGNFMPGAGGNPYLDDMFDVQSRKIGDAYSRNVMPTVNSKFAGSGRSGSGAHALGQRGADETLARELGDLGTEIYYGDYERRMGDRFKAAQLAPGANQSQLNNIGALRALGQDQESYEARFINEAMQRHQFAQNEPIDRLNRLGQSLGAGQGYGRGVAPGAPQGDSATAGGLGILSLIAQLGSAAISDIRVKEHIERIGESPSGIAIYEFEYKDGFGPAGRFEGVMAQELVGVDLDAVTEMPGGYLGVNYSMIDVDIRQVG